MRLISRMEVLIGRVSELLVAKADVDRAWEEATKVWRGMACVQYSECLASIYPSLMPTKFYLMKSIVSS